MFEYILTENKKLLTPFGIDLKDIKKETIQMADCIIDKSIYPNGFIIESHQYSDRILLRTNKELIDNGDGTMSVKL